MLCCIVGLLDTVRNCTYVGMADDTYALLQHNTHLYLANVINLRSHSLINMLIFVISSIILHLFNVSSCKVE